MDITRFRENPDDEFIQAFNKYAKKIAFPTKEFLDDLKVLDLYAIKKFSNGVSLSGRIDNITDEEAEPIPGYGNDGREIYITINYNW